MATSRPRSKRRGAGGFTLIETMIAMFIFAIGILSLAAMMSMVNLGTERSRYMGTATMLTTEKLEDLNHYGAASTVTAVSPGGSLGSDVTGYNDFVQIQSNNGEITETTVDPDANCLDIFMHYLPTSSSTQAASDTCTSSTTAVTTIPNAVTFHRRWLVENPVTVSGNSVAVRRVTVWTSLWTGVTNLDTAIFFQGQPVTLQMSTVRP